MNEFITRSMTNVIITGVAVFITFVLLGSHAPLNSVIIGALIGTFGYDAIYYFVRWYRRSKKETS